MRAFGDRGATEAAKAKVKKSLLVLHPAPPPKIRMLASMPMQLAYLAIILYLDPAYSTVSIGGTARNGADLTSKPARIIVFFT